jgi:hypothetical protein
VSPTKLIVNQLIEPGTVIAFRLMRPMRIAAIGLFRPVPHQESEHGLKNRQIPMHRLRRL